MSDASDTGSRTIDQGGVVIQFPGSRAGSPPPLPRLPRAIPTPGGSIRGNAFFEHVLTQRFDAEAA